ncbi:MAG: SWIM zinc finger family protein [Polyangiaceae bacterium]
MQRAGTALLVDVYFAAGDERFLEEVLRFQGAVKLAALAKPWFEDARPFARRALLAYVDDGCARVEHKALVKRLFKQAEAARDTELMGHFLVAFDRLARRVLITSGGRYDVQTRRWQPQKVLVPDPLVRERLKEKEGSAEFTRATRRYLARRVFRYFRKLGHQNPSAYRQALVPALARYRDVHLSSVGQLLSAWGLLHVLYGRSPVLQRSPKGIFIKAGRTLAELQPEPMFTAAWDNALDDVLSLLSSAESRPVRAWALALLRARYASELAALDLAQVKALALSPHEESQALGVELFARLQGLGGATLDDWLELLGVENLEVLAAICERAGNVVSGARLSVSQCIDLALSPAAPLASLGLAWLKEKSVTSDADLSQCLRLCSAKVPAVRTEAAEHNAKLLRDLPGVRPQHARELCDAQAIEVRARGLEVVAARFAGDAGLWLSLCESPYADVRSFVLENAARFRSQAPASLGYALGGALLALSGGASDKRRAARENRRARRREAVRGTGALAATLRRTQKRASLGTEPGACRAGQSLSPTGFARSAPARHLSRAAHRRPGERMRVDLRYQGLSAVRQALSGLELSFSPNLARPKVFFDAELRDPVRFREAVSALHDVVVGDLKAKKKDRSAWEAWKKQRADDEAGLRSAVVDQEKREALLRTAAKPIPPDLEPEFRRLHGIYWKARRQWASELGKNDPALFRALVPCDPVVTVAPDVVFFECFSKDESSYACLSVDREAFKSAGEAGLGTTNVDYSLALYDHFQTLRSYRPTRLLVDPSGFEVVAASSLREEKIDLPSSWLRGFGQLQAAMTRPSQRVHLSVDALYSLLSVLKRRRERSGPRSLKFLLEPGRPARVVIEPWDIEITSKGAPYGGPEPTEIKVWGRRRLLTLARLLPLADSVEVALLGTGLPSTWILRMGELRFVLALSGWTANDFTSGTNLDAVFAGQSAEPQLIDALRARLERERSGRLSELTQGSSERQTLAALHVLAKRGQVVYDFVTERYRYRPILPLELSEQALGPESPEVTEGVRLVSAVSIEREEPLGQGKRLYSGKVANTSCEAVVDADGQVSKARCSCSFFYRTRLRAGPCRHLLALKLHAKIPILSSASPR